MLTFTSMALIAAFFMRIILSRLLCAMGVKVGLFFFASCLFFIGRRAGHLFMVALEQRGCAFTVKFGKGNHDWVSK